MRILNMQGPFESRRIKLAALRQGHQIVPNGWIDVLLEHSSMWLGVRTESTQHRDKIVTNVQDLVVFKGLDDNHHVGLDHPDVGGCDILGQIVFVSDAPVMYQPVD